jgi:hypothetical protein
MAELIRDKALEDALLAAVIADQNERPRTKQMLIGPSEIGGCRELVRAKIFEDRSTFLPDTHWHTAAHVGTVMGEDLERIFGERLGAATQQRVTIELERLGLSVSGAIDLIFIRNQVVCDLKGTGAFGSVQYEGGVKLDYYIQISLYVWGLVKAGILQPGAEGRIVYYDRVGGEQTFIAVVVTWEAILNYVDLAQRRLQEVLNAQAGIEAGQLSMAHHLRDHVPSFCFSEKVQCPRRMHCWGGSDWAPLQVHDDADLQRATVEYIAGRKLENRGKAMKEQARGLLKGVEGHVVNGEEMGGLVGWKSGRISVVEIEALPAVQDLVDEVSTEWARGETREPFKPSDLADPAKVAELNARGVVNVADEYPPDPEAEQIFIEEVTGTHISSMSIVPKGEGTGWIEPVEADSPGESPPDDMPFQGGGLVTADEVQAWPTPPEQVLEQHGQDLTADQVAYLERKAEEARQAPTTSAERLSQLQKDVAADRKRRAGKA